ncbi:MAG: deaminase [Actinophytocola sp.]|uniref:dihydrofolate reductase family protein n=1 Tax=Actinophytocola sp. TaxID=1872138 RepID=UPI00132C825F|nr:dihydrofolate reductase family protein [Actinophytocola sp.]MPZ84731.1 deaminase [Actinophytocola sp.]
MRRLLPDQAADVDLFSSFNNSPGGVAQVRLSMVMSVDGSTTDEAGWTSRLGRPADKRLLRALRGVADAILVGAGSVRTGRYPPHRPPAEYRARRREAGRPEVAPLVVVTGSGDLDWSLPAFTDSGTPTLVLTCGRAPTPRLPADQVLVHGEATVDLDAGLGALRDRFGLCAVLCEGGPGLATELFRAGLVDELVVSLAPSIMPGRNRRLVDNPRRREELTLSEVYEEDGQVFLRYGVRARD